MKIEIKRKGKIVNSAMGSFLCPPDYPNTKSHVVLYQTEEFDTTDLAMDIARMYVPLLDENLGKRIKNIFEEYNKNKPSLDDESVKQWIEKVHSYFKHCFSRSSNIDFDVNDSEDVYIDENGDDFAENSCAVLFISRYYPEYMQE